MQLIAGDIGGTKTLLQLMRFDESGFTRLHLHRFDSGAYPEFDAVISEFLQQLDDTTGISAMCFGVAGPIEQLDCSSSAKVTNLPWTLNTAQLSAQTGIKKIALINDFAAMAHGISVMTEADLITVQAGAARRDGHRFVLGAGTGLGGAQLIYVDDAFHVVPSEIGHTDFAAFDSDSVALSHYYIEQQGRCCIENLLSGPGIEHIFRFVLSTGLIDTSLARNSNAALIADAGATDPAAAKTMELFASIYGSVAGNLALTNLAFGGVFLTGGIAAKNAELLSSAAFLKSFHNKGKMHQLMPRFPVYIVSNQECGLLGAAVFASQL